MDSLQDILSRYAKAEPPELTAVKQYIDEHFHTPVSVSLNGDTIIITVPSAALANTLRLNSTTISRKCKTTKRLLFRIG